MLVLPTAGSRCTMTSPLLIYTLCSYSQEGLTTVCSRAKRPFLYARPKPLILWVHRSSIVDGRSGERKRKKGEGFEGNLIIPWKAPQSQARLPCRNRSLTALHDRPYCRPPRSRGPRTRTSADPDCRGRSEHSPLFLTAWQLASVTIPSVVSAWLSNLHRVLHIPAVRIVQPILQ